MLPRQSELLYIGLCVLLIRKTSLLFIHGLHYKELQDLRVDCPPLDTCFNRSEKNAFLSYQCTCDAACMKEASCCIDSPYLDTASTLSKTICSKLYHSDESVLMICRCSNTWKNENSIKQLCESTDILLGDPIEITPVTNPSNGLTYKNYFCARCNNDDSEVLFWKVELNYSVNSSDTQPTENNAGPLTLEYDPFANQWMLGRPVYFHISKPDHFSSEVAPKCRSDIFGECNSEWRNEEVRRKCESYQAPVIFDGKYFFRNIHCAICNDISDLNNINCALDMARNGTGPYGSRKFAFFPPTTVLFGHMMFDKKCVQKEEIYMELLRQCRRIITKRTANLQYCERNTFLGDLDICLFNHQTSFYCHSFKFFNTFLLLQLCGFILGSLLRR